MKALQQGGTLDPLYRRVRRAEEQCFRRGYVLTGRQMLRMILLSYQTNPTAKELFNITHLHQLKYLGDARMGEFLEAWLRLLNEQEGELTERRKELLFYSKIKGSVVLKSYLDYYDRLPDSAPEHSYA